MLVQVNVGFDNAKQSAMPSSNRDVVSCFSHIFSIAYVKSNHDFAAY